MNTTAAETAVSASIVVEVPAEQAFRVFTEDIGDWWDPDHHILGGELAEMVFETRVGGHVYDRAVDGSECRWARVLAFDPPHSFVISWDINLDWQLESDPARASEVEVRFTPQGEGQTLVELEHRHIDRHGEGWENMRNAVGSPGGWPAGLDGFAARLAA